MIFKDGIDNLAGRLVGCNSISLLKNCGRKSVVDQFNFFRIQIECSSIFVFEKCNLINTSLSKSLKKNWGLILVLKIDNQYYKSRLKEYIKR